MAKQEWTQVVKKSKYAELLPYIVAMSRHETGNYTSTLYRRANNLFGIKTFARVTPYPSKSGGYYRVYCCLEDSASDLIELFSRRNFPTKVSSEDQFVDELVRIRYFEDRKENYLKGIKRWLSG